MILGGCHTITKKKQRNPHSIVSTDMALEQSMNKVIKKGTK